MIKRALLAFVITFCAPALVIDAIRTYAHIGKSFSEKIYEGTHDTAP